MATSVTAEYDMNANTSTNSGRKLSEDTYRRCMDVALDFLIHNASIRNRELREVAGIGYDQATTFFNRAILEKRLVRKGCTSGTHYILSSRSKY